MSDPSGDFSVHDMQPIFLEFQRLNGTTWFYLSFLLMIAVYFRFDRFFSIRNWDVVSLFLLVPGLLATTRIDRGMLELLRQARIANGGNPAFDTQVSRELLNLGYIWLFVLTGYLFVRCIVDLFLARRPRLEPNLNNAGLAFLGVSLLSFLMYEVLIKAPDPAGRASAEVATRVFSSVPAEPAEEPSHPVHAFLKTHVLRPVISRVTDGLREDVPVRQSDVDVAVARSTVVLCHMAILAALILIGWQHFAQPSAGMGMATLYLLSPLTALNVEKVDHILPSAFLVWAVYAYRRPLVAGLLVGAAGMFFFPLFLVPLWAGFYFRRGARWFLLGIGVTTTVMCLLIWQLDPFRSFMEVWSSSVAWKAWDIHQNPQTLGFWTEATQVFRFPIFVAFSAGTLVLGFWPKEKNLAELIALSVALILGVQFWYADRGGTYVHWYLPLLLLMFFRPNLSEHRPPCTVAKT